MISGSSDKTIRQWDLANPERDPVVLQGHGSWVWSVAVSRGGNRVVSGSAGGTVREWNINSRNLSESVCQVVGRNLSRHEWVEFIGSDVEYELTCPNLPAGEGSQLNTSSASH